MQQSATISSELIDQFHSILDEDNWIVEGAYYNCLDQSFQEADNIYILDIHPIVYKHRLFKRFIRSKLRLDQHQKEISLHSLREGMKRADKYSYKLDMIKNDLFDRYTDKVKYLTSSKDVENQLR